MHTATRRCLSMCASISQKTRRVCLICRVTATDSFWVYCTLSFSLVAKLRTMTVSGTPANWLDEELRRRCLPFPPLFSLLSVLPLLQSYAVFSSLRSLSSHALDISSLPLALRYVLLSLGHWSINTTRSAPSCSKKSLPTLGTTKSVTDTNGKSNTFYCFAALGLGRWEFILKWKSDKKVHTQTHTPDHIVNVTLHLPTDDCFNKTPMKHLQTAYFECQKTENHTVHSSDAHI